MTVSQINQSHMPWRTTYNYLANLDLADYSCVTNMLEVDILIGSDHYWKLVTGEVIWSGDGPMAIQTKLGWVLSGPGQELLCESTFCKLVTMHMLKVDTYASDDTCSQQMIHVANRS